MQQYRLIKLFIIVFIFLMSISIIPIQNYCELLKKAVCQKQGEISLTYYR